MPSPFPGMNPYLERKSVWHGFHEAFVIDCQRALVPQIRPEFIASLDDNIYIHELSADERRLVGRSDVSLSVRSETTALVPGGTTVIAPVTGRVLPQVDVLRENFIEIRDRESRELVTVIDVLSPTNKRPGSDRDQFLNKRYQLMTSTAHYVEIDLLRGEPRLPIENLPDCDAYVMVSHVEQRPSVGLWPIGLRDRLPEIPIPLRDPIPEVRLDLQTILDHAYDSGGYEDYIYSGAPEPPLPSADAAWATEQLRSLEKST
ncbi:MAG: DUF4058 family protein [Planctomycetaceae bacterium]|nr:DUF4058 family protein [Planctomycetaceae bacterium]